jgi:AraC-like DNA-binding protein
LSLGVRPRWGGCNARRSEAGRKDAQRRGRDEPRRLCEAPTGWNCGGAAAEKGRLRHARLNAQSQVRFLALAAEQLDDPFLGFHLARDFDLREIGLLHYVLASSATIGDALRRVVRYSHTANEGVTLRYFENNGGISIAFSYVGLVRHSDRQQIEFWVTAVVRSLRELASRQLAPNSVAVVHHRQEDCSELNEFLGTTATFDAEADIIVFARTIMDIPVATADPYLNELLVAYCEEALARRAPGGGVTPSDVENAIASLLPHGMARVDEVARKLGMSRRTLARRLESEGSTFSDVLNRLRGDLARRHIADSALSVSQIAWLLGYREVSAFTHAFKRWTGKTPREMRALQNAARD